MAAVSLSSSSSAPLVKRPAQVITSSEHCETTAKIIALKIASYLTEPLCKVREYFYTLRIISHVCAEKIIGVALLIIGMIVCLAIGTFTAPLGGIIRGLVVTFESKPFIYQKRPGEGATLPPEKSFTLFTHNQCLIPAGYPITDGGVTPVYKSRVDANIAKINQLKPDVVCLYEIPDICDSDYIASKLKDYPYIIHGIGMRMIGPSSMMFIASKYEIVKESVQFIPFDKRTEMSGRSRFSEKGFISFDLASQNDAKPFATIVSTHLQHSEIPSAPEDHEKSSREKQLDKIGKHVQPKLSETSVILTGDLNLNEEEWANYTLSHPQPQWTRSEQVKKQHTWGGDEWCAGLMGKRASAPAVLDYTFTAGKQSEIATQIHSTQYDGRIFNPTAISDHNILFSTIKIA